jgi:hypothetical protein
VRVSEFWELVEGEFGSAFGRSLVRDQVLPALADRTAAQALDAGSPPREVWAALCDAMQVPADRRWGPDPRKIAREGPAGRRG